MDFGTFGYQSSTGLRGTSTQIYDIFRTYTNALYDEKRKAYQAIDDWSYNFIQQIRDYAIEQKHLVDQAYRNHDKHQDTMRDQFVAEGYICDRNRDTQETERLLEKCRTLKVELIKLNFEVRTNDYIRMIPVEPSERMDQEKLYPNNIVDDKFEKESRQTITTESKLDKNSNINSNSSSTFRPFTHTNSRSNNHATNAHGLSASNTTDNKSTNDTMSDEKSDNKCPICLMIFPSYMSETSRTMHVEEHCKDD